MALVGLGAPGAASAWPSATVFLVALLAALVVTPLAIVLARRTGIMDRPGALKTHEVAVPYLGGLGVAAGVLVGTRTSHPWVLVAAFGALVLGTADDRFDLPPAARLAGEVLLGVALALALPSPGLGMLGRAGVVAVTMVLINGVNLMDGLDGLAGGVGAVAGLSFGFLLWQQGPSDRNLAIGLLGGLLGFLAFNRPPARIYLGDGGSYLLGTTLAALAVLAWTSTPHGPSTGLLGLAIVALPTTEIVFAIFRRARGHQPILAGDRGHPYDRLVQRGWSRPAASAAYVAVEAVVAGIAVAIGHLRPGRLGWSLGVLAVAAVLLVVLAGISGGLTPDVVSSVERPTPPDLES